MGTRKSGPMGRPRGFDADEALERAMLTFWEHGYEGASLTTLTRAMGISTTSMYTAFGNKEELFRKALARYSEGPSAYLARALEEPTAREVAAAVLTGVIRSTTRPAHPRGCMGVHGALAAGDAAQDVRDLLADWRGAAYSRIRDRFARAADEGDLPPGGDPAVLARYVATLAFGIAVQAAGGVGRADLQRMADTALTHGPLA